MKTNQKFENIAYSESMVNISLAFQNEMDRLHNVMKTNAVHDIEYVPVQRNIIRSRDKDLELAGDLKFTHSNRFDRLNQ